MPARETDPTLTTPNGIEALGPMFLSAEDFDATGILAGVEPCASNYWWIPELHHVPLDAFTVKGSVLASGFGSGVEHAQPAVSEATAVPARHHAARRTPPRSTAA